MIEFVSILVTIDKMTCKQSLNDKIQWINGFYDDINFIAMSEQKRI